MKNGKCSLENSEYRLKNGGYRLENGDGGGADWRMGGGGVQIGEWRVDADW